MRFTCGYLPLTANVVYVFDFKDKKFSSTKNAQKPYHYSDVNFKDLSKKNKLRCYVYYHKRLDKLRRQKNVEVVKEVELSSNLRRTSVEL